MNKFSGLLVVLCGLSLVSCVGSKNFRVLTTPDGADITINGKPAGKSPVTVEIDQSRALAIVAHKPGYQSASETVPTRTNWFLSLLWTENDPKARYIDMDEITIPLRPIQSVNNYRPSRMTPFNAAAMERQTAPTPQQSTRQNRHVGEAPALREMPQF